MSLRVENQQLASLLAAWLPGIPFTLRIGGQGMNNTTRFVEAEDGRTYVLRVYNTHRDADKVRFEHETLLALADQRLGFDVPRPLEAAGGGTFVRCSETGKLAALFVCLPGCSPERLQPDTWRQLAEAAATLSVALRRVQPAAPAAYRPYYELGETHPSCPLPAVAAWCERPPAAFAQLEAELQALARQVAAFAEQAAGLRELPHQLVHGDLNASNLLVDERGRLCALLDFEFVTYDVRVMELAVLLSDLLVPAQAPEGDEEAMWQTAEACIRAFSERAGLTAEELSKLPLLVALRRLDVFIHFLGRYLDGTDEAGDLQRIIASSAKRLTWLDSRTDRLRAAISSARDFSAG
ncbi:phosphotransferase [Paenibacillus athensensis]|uniref:Aminoglycoside phosphotransferase domain-containing protein n=1 Tax=Paenibacillus athensensis TaxID=1967502 RepID=A0A4Y8QA48_9BACL|nr:phosphotransferase [Paenibacillus athensensis]MCD1257720.1 phosphotransferase [Paenibacillus athensensis]